MTTFVKLRLLLSVLLLSALVANCGDKDDDDDSDMDSGPDSSTDVDTDADADTDSDADTDTDTDTGTGTDTGPADPCSPNPCDTPPDAGCAGNNYETYPSMGTCSESDAGAALCEYPADASVDCGAQFCSTPLSGCVDCLIPTDCTGWLETCDSTGYCVCNDDPNEPNDTAATASSTPSGTLTVCSGNDDWWEIGPVGGCSAEVDVIFTHADGNLDAVLYLPSAPSNPIDTGDSTTDNEDLWGPNGQTMLLHVYGVSGAANNYTIYVGSGGC